MTDEPHLILHKVCGQPSWDIAIQMEVKSCLDIDKPEIWWIIPTSGHRAYPWAHWPISELLQSRDHMIADAVRNHSVEFARLRDHFATSNTELLDQAQFGRVVHKRPAAKPHSADSLGDLL